MLLGKRQSSSLKEENKKALFSESELLELVSFAVESKSMLVYDYNHRRITCKTAKKNLEHSELPRILQKGSQVNVRFEHVSSERTISIMQFDKSMPQIFSKEILKAIEASRRTGGISPKEILSRFISNGFINRDCYDLIVTTPKLCKKFSNITLKLKKQPSSTLTSSTEGERSDSSFPSPLSSSPERPQTSSSSQSSSSLDPKDEQGKGRGLLSQSRGCKGSNNRIPRGESGRFIPFKGKTSRSYVPKTIVDNFLVGLAKKLTEKYTKRFLFSGSLLFYDRSLLSI